MFIIMNERKKKQILNDQCREEKLIISKNDGKKHYLPKFFIYYKNKQSLAVFYSCDYLFCSGGQILCFHVFGFLSNKM